MVKVQDPSFVAVSDTVHVTVVVPNSYVPPDVTTIPEASRHVMLASVMVSTLSVAVGVVGDQVTVAVDCPVSVLIPVTSLGQATVGDSVSVGSKHC